MPQRINTFSNLGFIEFDSGCFDRWCVFVTKPGGERFAPTDAQYFSRLAKLAEKHGPQKIYDDFVVVFNRTGKSTDPKVLDLILCISKFYAPDELEMEIWLNVLYAGMIAEENKAHAILKKRIKRLGMHQVLLDGFSPNEAAVFSKGKKWQELDGLMTEKGF